ncbi:hypothetical protein F5B19DRAFT_503041 [Rostrohypoxylon terebratum]|nr:hypothetical protein F5B19DRAFT_503041 [Rostrohypoxylon terebratum]
MAIGLVGNIITFLDFGYKLVSTAKGIHASASGSSAYNEALSHSTQQLQQLVANLKNAKPPGSFSNQEPTLLQVVTDCESVSVELAKLLGKLRAQNPKSMRGAFRAAIQNWRKKDEKTELELKLDRCKQQLSLELMNISRSESLERLNKLLAHGQAGERELQSLIRSVESLRLGTNVSCLDSEALDQIKSLLQLTDDAILNVRQARILDALRFKRINERFEDIEEAHRKTFSWIFAGQDDIASASESSLHNKDGNDHSYGYGHEDDQISGRNSESKSVVSSLDSTLIYTEAGSSTGSFRNMNSMSTAESESSDNSSFQWILDDLSSIGSDGDPQVSDSRSFHSDLSSQQQQQEAPIAFSDTDVPISVRENLRQARDSFVSWLQRDSGIFYISGKPGSGKSTFMKYVSQHRETTRYLRAWAGEKKLVFGAFFFWKPGSVLQKSIKGLIRGLLYCLLSECHDLIPFAFPVQWESSLNRGSVHIEHNECHEAFERLISASKSHGEHKIALFVDGLDEFEGNHATLIRQLLAWCNENPNVKICVSSREWVIFKDAFGCFPEVRLHDLTSSDIRMFVQDRFREMNLGALLNTKDRAAPGISNITDLEEAIVNESDGVFLWVSIVLRHVEDGLANGDQLRDLVRLIRSLPNDLEPMFQQLLESIPRNNRRLAYSMLASVRSTSFSNIPLMQFSFLEEYTEDTDFALKLEVNLLTTRERIDRLERTKRRIYGLCKGLLELRPPDTPIDLSGILGSAVRLTHRSISEFLESQYFMQKLDLELRGFDPCDAYCHTYLGLLQRVHLPASYYASRYSYQIPDPFMAVFDFCPPLSLRHNIDLMIQQHISTGQRASSRFFEALDVIHKTLISLKVDSERYRCALVVRHSDVAVRCDPKDLIMIACSQAGFYEYLSLKRGISPKLRSCCFPAALLSLRSMNPQRLELWYPALKTLEVLLNHGTSPDSSITPRRESAFHMMLQEWCYRNEPNLPTIAFMLYHGANPRFSFVISKTTYTFLRDRRRPIFKLYFTSEYFPSDAEQGMQTRRILRRHGRHYAIEASDAILRIIEEHGHVIDLTTLVALWFPNQSAILQEVIDWILALGCPVEAHHRAELQDRFGPALRPFFEPNHPDFAIHDREPDWKHKFPKYSEKVLRPDNIRYKRRVIFSIPRARFPAIRRRVKSEEEGN